MSKSTIIAFIFLFTGITSSGSEKLKNFKGELISIPLDLNTKRPVLLVAINGKGPFKFIFDTGSSEHVIDQDLAQSLGFMPDQPDTGNTSGYTGIFIPANINNITIKIPETDISDNVKMNTAQLRKYYSVDGILSPSFFSKYLVTLDYQNAQLILSTGELIMQGSNVIPLGKISNAINFLITIKDIKTECRINSGNIGWVDIPYSLKEKLGIRNEVIESGAANTSVDSSRKWNGTLKGNIKIGSINYIDPEIRLIEGIDYASLGYRFLAEYRITIDIKNQMIKFEKATQFSSEQDLSAETNDYTGMYGELRILLKDRKMSLQKREVPPIELMEIRYDFYKLISDKPETNDILNVRFERDAANSISGVTLFYKDGREKYVKKD